MKTPSGTFLIPQELRELTGSAPRRLQIEWLAARHWPFELDQAGRPVVLRQVLECKLGLTGQPADTFTLDEATVN